MRNKLRKKTTLKTKIPPALSHEFLLDQQKKIECSIDWNSSWDEIDLMSIFHKNRVHDNTKNKPETLKAIERYKSTDKPKCNGNAIPRMQIERISNFIKNKTRNTRENIETHQAIDKTKGPWKAPATS